jgi:hypothetical protein
MQPLGIISKIFAGVKESYHSYMNPEQESDSDAESSLPEHYGDDVSVKMPHSIGIPIADKKKQSYATFEDCPPKQVPKPFVGLKLIGILRAESAKQLKISDALINLHAHIAGIVGIKSPYKQRTLAQLNASTLPEWDYTVVDIDIGNEADYKAIVEKGGITYFISTKPKEEEPFPFKSEQPTDEIRLYPTPTIIYYTALKILQKLESLGWGKM